MRKLKVILIGAGNRGAGYTDIMHEMPEKFEVVAVAEPIDNRREYIQKKHSIPDELCFKNWQELLAKEKIADVAVISTQDSQHYAPAMEAITRGYQLLLEKPAAPTPKECLDIAQHAKECGVHVIVCHVLRYTDLFCKIKALLDEGVLGDVISVNHEECVGNVHQSHSYVRGNWGNEERSSCMLLAKSCHDLDLLQWLIGRKCEKIQSFGTLTYFKKKNAPAGSPDRCIDGCPVGDTCPYNAVKLYLDDKKNAWFRTTSTRCVNPTDEQVEHTLRTTQYGSCVYKCDNDVVDHQTVNMVFEGGVTATFTMCAFNRGGRYIHIMGTKGELHAAMDGDSPIRVYDFVTKKEKEISLTAADGIGNGHGGGDFGIVEALYEYLTDSYTGSSISDIAVSVQNHLMVFAAEESRKTNTVVDIEEYVKAL